MSTRGLLRLAPLALLFSVHACERAADEADVGAGVGEPGAAARTVRATLSEWEVRLETDTVAPAPSSSRWPTAASTSTRWKSSGAIRSG